MTTALRGLYLVTDRQLCGDRGVVAVVGAALRGGVRVVQLREKGLSTRDFVAEAREVHALTAKAGVPLIINDRVDVALAVGAEGVHIGQSDMLCADVRRILGPAAIIGLSVETPVQLVAAESTTADYFGISPVFITPTKADLLQGWGLGGLRQARRLTRRPLVAIGGIHLANAAQVHQAGADALAVVSAICAAADPTSAASLLVAAMNAQPAGGS